jgi:hypothetical protein
MVFVDLENNPFQAPNAYQFHDTRQRSLGASEMGFPVIPVGIPDPSSLCPKCQSPNLIGGIVRGSGLKADDFLPNSAGCAEPEAGLPLDKPFRCCTLCGLIWSRVDREEVLAFVKRRTEAAAQLRAEHIARQLAEASGEELALVKISEIESQIAWGVEDGSAVRRFRELTGGTWDQAIRAINRWPDLTLKEKMAHFGWAPVEKIKVSLKANQVHPLHDFELDH